RGFPVEYLVAPDEGHGFARPINNLAMYAAAEKFLAKHLGGRFEESGSAEVLSRLREITVDPKTVTVAKTVSVSSAGTPKPATGLTGGTYKYAVKLETGGRSINLSQATAIKEQGDSWEIVDSMLTPMGEATDLVLLQKGSLTLLKRSIKQGAVVIDMSVNQNNLSGTFKINGQEKSFTADLGGPLFADAAGAGFAIGALPLAEGYSSSFRNFDLQKQKVKVMQMNVTGSDRVTVPAGTFDTWRVDLTSAEGGPEKATIWIAKNERKPVKMSAAAPQMGGATLVSELQ